MNATNKNQQISKQYQGINFDNIDKCVHCGLCLDACPTYRETGLEQSSPRGRLYVMRGLWNGSLEFNKESVMHLDTCLDCRACETACPSKVPYGELIEKTKSIIHKEIPPSFIHRTLQSFFFKKILPSDSGLKIFSVFLKLWQTVQGDKLLTLPPFSHVLPSFMVKGQYMLPRFSFSSFKSDMAGKHDHIKLLGAPETDRKKVALFTGCIADVSDQEVQSASLKLMRLAGAEVEIPKTQKCCGALQVHGGDRDTGRKMARANLDVFNSLDIEHIITNAGGCSAQLKEYHLLFSDGEKIDRERLALFESKIIDVLEYLGKIPKFVSSQKWDDTPETVLFDAPCHLMHAQQIDKNPRALISKLPGVKLVTLDESEYCCGSAGIYNLIHAELADKILDRKILSIERALEDNPGTKYLLTGNPGCQFQIRYGIKKRGLPLTVLHPAVYIEKRLSN